MARLSMPLAPPAVEYSSSDGQPIAETDHQRTPLTYAVEALLRHHFRDRADVYVSERREEGMNTPAQEPSATCRRPANGTSEATRSRTA